MDCRVIFDLYYHLKSKVKALKSTGVELLIAQNTKANFLHGAWANVVHTPVNGVKSAGNGVESTVNGMKSPRNAVKNPGNPGTFF